MKFYAQVVAAISLIHRSNQSPIPPYYHSDVVSTAIEGTSVPQSPTKINPPVATPSNVPVVPINAPQIEVAVAAVVATVILGLIGYGITIWLEKRKKSEEHPNTDSIIISLAALLLTVHSGIVTRDRAAIDGPPSLQQPRTPRSLEDGTGSHTLAPNHQRDPISHEQSVGSINAFGEASSQQPRSTPNSTTHQEEIIELNTLISTPQQQQQQPNSLEQPADGEEAHGPNHNQQQPPDGMLAVPQPPRIEAADDGPGIDVDIGMDIDMDIVGAFAFVHDTLIPSVQRAGRALSATAYSITDRMRAPGRHAGLLLPLFGT